MVVAVDVARDDDRRGRGELLEDGALGGAVAAPRAGEDEDVRAPRELAEQLLLRVGDPGLLRGASPLRPVGVGAVLGEEIGQRQCRAENLSKRFMSGSRREEESPPVSETGGLRRYHPSVVGFLPGAREAA